MKMVLGHPAATFILMTTYKLTCITNSSSVLLRLKEIQSLTTGQQNISCVFHWTASTGTATKRTTQIRFVKTHGYIQYWAQYMTNSLSEYIIITMALTWLFGLDWYFLWIRAYSHAAPNIWNFMPVSLPHVVSWAFSNKKSQHFFLSMLFSCSFMCVFFKQISHCNILLRLLLLVL